MKTFLQNIKFEDKDQQGISLEGEDLPFLENLHEKARKLLETIHMPTVKDEAWKYTDISSFLKKEYCLAQDDLCADHCDCHQKTLPFEAYEIHFCNGRLHEHFHFPSEIEAMSLLDAFVEHQGSKYVNKSFDVEKYPFAVLNTAYMAQGLFLKIARQARLDKPIVLVYHMKKNASISQIRNIIVLENGAEAEIAEYFLTQGENCFNNIVNEFFIGSSASLTHERVLVEKNSSVSVFLNSVNVKDSGVYKNYALEKNSGLSRNETYVRLKEENASAEICVAYDAGGQSLIDTTTVIEHSASCTSSNQLIKGVANERGKGVFQGKIHIAPNIARAEGFQLHKSMLLSETAQVDVKPELEIFADDVRCSHGAASGEIDEQQLFYLRSRGISEEAAKKMLIKAFVEEVFEKIENSEIKSFMEQKFFERN